MIKVDYLLHLHQDYATGASRSWPLLLFLHGANGRGDDLRLVRRQGLPKMLDEGDDLPLVIVSPQCPREEWWSSNVLAALLDELDHRYAVDRNRIYTSGWSLGGTGTWALAIAHPDRFAAIAPICGVGQPSKASAIAHLPVWVFHGEKDSIVPLKRSEEMVSALKKCGGDVRFTIYCDIGHDCWRQTYANRELYTWLLAHTRGQT